MSIIFSIALLLAMTLGIHPVAMAKATPAADTQTSTQIRSFDDLPPVLTPALAKALHDELSLAYHMKRTRAGFRADNPGHGMNFTFTKEGPQVKCSGGDWQWGLSLTRWGYAGSMGPVPSARLAATGGKLSYSRGPVLSEWYFNSPWGLEQGFTISSPPPSGQEGEKLVLEMAISGTLRPKLENDTLLLHEYSGRQVARYTGLYAYDADGKSCPAHLSLSPMGGGQGEGRTLRILINDSGARYPVTIDPWLQQAKLTAGDGDTQDYFGYSVAISGDTVVVGAYWDNIGGIADQGSAYIFEKPVGGWATTNAYDAKLTASDGAAYDHFGCSVSISGDTVVVGAYLDDIGLNDNQGSAYIFEKPVGGWATTSAYDAKLTASDGAAEDWFGVSVAISGDTVVIGAYRDDSGDATDQGSVYVFEKPVGGWITTNAYDAKLTASDGTGGDHFGVSVSTSEETAVIGAYFDDVDGNYNQGSAYVFEKPVGGWFTTSDYNAKLTASDGMANDYFGYSVAISGDTAVIGAYRDDIGGNNDQGSAYVFEKPVGGWSNDDKLTASDGAAYDNFGISVFISGNTVVVGAHYDDFGGGNDQGSANIFSVPAVGDELAVDFGINGLWHLDGSWIKLSNWNPDDDLSGWSGGLGVDFGTNGLWNNDGSSWSRITTWDAGSGGLSGWSGGLAVDFDGSGLWNFDGSAWTKMTNWDVDGDVAGWSGGLGVDFGGNGVWNNDGSSWSRITAWDAGTAGLADWNDGLAVDFDASGLWSFDGSTWVKLTNWDAEDDLTGWPGGLAVDFGTNGLWSYDGSSWSRLTTWDAGVMTGVADGLAVDFNANGVWKFDGSSWTKITNWNAENMADCDLN